MHTARGRRGISRRRTRQRAVLFATLRDELNTVRLGEAPGESSVFVVVRELFQCRLAAHYSVARGLSGLAVVDVGGIGAPLERLRAASAAAVAGATSTIVYDPSAVVPVQRNRVFSADSLVRAGHVSPDARERLETNTQRILGIPCWHQLRVVLTEGSTMLRHVGVYRCRTEAPYDASDERLLQRLTPFLQRRAALDLRLREAELTRATALASLDLVLQPAFVLDARGHVALANGLGQALLDARAHETLSALSEAARGDTSHFRSITLSSPGLSGHRLLVARGEHRDDAARLSDRAREWTLTRREREVLALLIKGFTNAMMARDFGVTERAVELHVTHLFDKAGVDNRAALVSRVWSG